MPGPVTLIQLNELERMSLFHHLVLAFCYVAFGLAVALTLPFSLPSVDDATAMLAGGLVCAFGALFHEVAARKARERDITERIDRMRRDQAHLADRIDHLRAGLDALKGAMPTAAQAVSAAEVEALRVDLGALGTRLDDVAASVRATLAASGPGAASGAPPERRARTAARTRAWAGAGLDPARILDCIDDALRNDVIDIHLEPIVSLPQRKPRHYEVFARIRTPDGGHLDPPVYRPVAERENLAAALDNLMLFRCIQLVRESERRHSGIGFFSNLSPATMGDPDFMPQFVQFMAQNPTLAGKLVFELSQHDFTTGGAAVTEALSELGRLGFRFSLDTVSPFDIDFEDIARHDIRYLKFDADRLLNWADDPDAPRRFLDLKRRLDRYAVDLIVEGVDSEQQLVELLDLHLDFGQGPLFADARLPVSGTRASDA